MNLRLSTRAGQIAEIAITHRTIRYTNRSRNVVLSHMGSHFNNPMRKHPRRGSVSIWAIACLVFVAALSVTLGKMALSGSRYTLQERRHSQADWLAHSGWNLALTQLKKNADYKGETWSISAADLGGVDGGQVKIEVSSAGESAESKTVKVVAEYPVNSDRKVRVTRSRTWQKPKP